MTHGDEIFVQSQCWEKEQQIVTDIENTIQSQGYHCAQKNFTKTLWQKNQNKIAVCLVDDVWDIATHRQNPAPYLFDRDTTVVTDNQFNFVSVYDHCSLPASFYSIYNYTPTYSDWNPSRDYTFAVNRLDFKRMQILLELDRTLGINSGHVNFNCATDRYHESIQDRQQAFKDECRHSDNATDLAALNHLADSMPLKNYNFDHEQTYVSSWLNIIVETYSSDHTVSLSEKTFRCLVSPAPWISFSGRHSLVLLQKLGFDVLIDIVDHSHDSLLERDNKVKKFAESAANTINKLKLLSLQDVTARCHRAAQTNQLLLAQMATTWPSDFEHWLEKLSQRI
jgi:hypothetical protein